MVKDKREELNLTQEQLAEKSGISVRTIQRIEAGMEPKGHTLDALAKALNLEISDLKKGNQTKQVPDNTWLKVINFSSLPLSILPPLNILIPVILMHSKKQVNPISKKIVSLQTLWFIGAGILFMLASFLKNWFDLGSRFILGIMVLLVLINVFVILRNAIELDKRGKLFFDLNFSIF